MPLSPDFVRAATEPAGGSTNRLLSCQYVSRFNRKKRVKYPDSSDPGIFPQESPSSWVVHTRVLGTEVRNSEELAIGVCTGGAGGNILDVTPVTSGTAAVANEISGGLWTGGCITGPASLDLTRLWSRLWAGWCHCQHHAWPNW